MSSRKHLLIAICLALAVFAAGWFAAVWPVYRRIDAIDRESRSLLQKAADLGVKQEEIDELSTRLAETEHRITNEMKRVPEAPDIAELMRILSLPLDGVTVLDQEFTAADINEPVPGYDVEFMAAPLYVNMVARFDAVFALIRAAESMGQLLRVNSLRLNAQRDAEGTMPMADASIALEVIYDPPDDAREGRR
ncbi:MAG: hypothetical protein ACYS0D_08135 [Planctomycetota bacterium]|jgi:Tfp pilus assembly protein PilO